MHWFYLLINKLMQKLFFLVEIRCLHFYFSQILYLMVDIKFSDHNSDQSWFGRRDTSYEISLQLHEMYGRHPEHPLTKGPWGVRPWSQFTVCPTSLFTTCFAAHTVSLAVTFFLNYIYIFRRICTNFAIVAHRECKWIYSEYIRTTGIQHTYNINRKRCICSSFYNIINYNHFPMLSLI